MIIERKRTLPVPPDTVTSLLTNIDRLNELVPQAERIEVLQRSEGRARIAITLRLGRLGHRRIDGEARLLSDGMRFIAVTPTQIDLRWIVRPAANGSEVAARMDTDLARLLGPLARLVPGRVIDRKIGEQIDLSLDALERLCGPAEPTPAPEKS